LGKPCALGSVGFPYAETCRRRTRRFRLLRTSIRKPNRHLEHTIIPKLPTTNSLEDFLDRFLAVLIFFCNAHFNEQSFAGIGHTSRAFTYPCASLKAGYSAHSAFAPHRQVSPRSVETKSLPSRVSTENGSGFACRCKPPRILNSQQQPRFGQKKPSPETSSICPSTIFYPRLRNGGI